MAVSLPVGNLRVLSMSFAARFSKAILNRSSCSKKEKAQEGMYFEDVI